MGQGKFPEADRAGGIVRRHRPVRSFFLPLFPPGIRGGVLGITENADEMAETAKSARLGDADEFVVRRAQQLACLVQPEADDQIHCIDTQFPAAGVEQRVLAHSELTGELLDSGKSQHPGFANTDGPLHECFRSLKTGCGGVVVPLGAELRNAVKPLEEMPGVPCVRFVKSGDDFLK